MEKKKIAWISPLCFVDVDLPIIKEMQSNNDIHWIVVLNEKGNDTKDYILNSLGDNKKVSLSFMMMEHRQRSLKQLLFIWKFVKLAKSSHPDIIYISEYAMPYGIVVYRLLLPLKKTVAACHNVTTPKGAKNESFARLYTWLWLSTFKNIQTFSKSQKDILLENYKGKNVLLAHLALKDYGEPVINYKQGNEVIRFLFFGNIVRYKRLDLLIEASNILYEKGFRNFRIRIAGSCLDWSEKYAPLIKHPELFELQIERVPNSEVANLFGSSQYFVMPYQDIAQSGAIMVAFRYNLPVLCSDIIQFEEFVQDGYTGYTFKSKDVKSLAEKMEWIIKNHSSQYKIIRANEQMFVDENLALPAIVKKYQDYFNTICNK